MADPMRGQWGLQPRIVGRKPDHDLILAPKRWHDETSDRAQEALSIVRRASEEAKFPVEKISINAEGNVRFWGHGRAFILKTTPEVREVLSVLIGLCRNTLNARELIDGGVFMPDGSYRTLAQLYKETINGRTDPSSN